MNLVEGSSVKVVDLARVPEGIAYPSYKKLTLIGCVIGVGLTLAIIVCSFSSIPISRTRMI